jgi:hypothetical protein
MTIFAAVLAVAQTAFSQAPPAQPPVPPAELQAAKKTVQTFCTYWKSLKFDSMYVMMSKAAQTGMPQAIFNHTYGVMPDSLGRLGSFSVKEALSSEDGVLVKAELIFLKEKPATAINGVHNFHMIKENGKWKVKTIVPPIFPPKDVGSGGHPGE